MQPFFLTLNKLLIGYIHKISQYLRGQYLELLSSFLRQFQVHYTDGTSTPWRIVAGVPQGSVRGPLLYVLFTVDIPIDKAITTATFADDTAILSAHDDYHTATTNLQRPIDER